MIIECNNCKKNFDIDTSFIPKNGRLLQCYSCDHKWFFKKEILDKSVNIMEKNDPSEKKKALKEILAPLEEKITSAKTELSKTAEPLESTTNILIVEENNSTKNKTEKNEVKENDKKKEIKTSKIKKDHNILSLTIVFIISFMALIIIFDTFQKPISGVIPNIEFLLYNFYETINDIALFFRDLI